jgi:glyoxylase-like metal-dependent hydrolase (beta-lactamase superfamily II)
VTVTRPLVPGRLLELRDRSLEVLHRPGHSPSDTVFWDAERRIMIGGDHLIGHISSNPLLTRPLGDTGEEDAASPRPQALVAYIASLEATREMEIDVILAGHGRPVEGHAALIDERLRQHERRAQRIYELVVERPRTAYEIAQALWGTVAVTQAYLTLSEVLGHADLLLNQGRLVETVARGLATFEVAGG